MLRVRQYWKAKIKRVEFSIGGFKMYGGWEYISLDKKRYTSVHDIRYLSSWFLEPKTVSIVSTKRKHKKEN